MIIETETLEANKIKIINVNFLHQSENILCCVVLKKISM